MQDCKAQLQQFEEGDLDGRSVAEASAHLEAVLLRAQENGNEKLQEVEIIQDLIDNRHRSLNNDHNKLSEYFNNAEESEEEESEDIIDSWKSSNNDVSSSSEDLSPNDVELPSDEEVSQDEGEQSSDDVEMSWPNDSVENVMSDDDVSAMSEDADDLDDFISSTEKSEETYMPGETFNTSDYTECSDNASH